MIGNQYGNYDWEQRKSGNIFKTISDKGFPELPVLSASQEKGMILRDTIGIDIKYDEKSVKNYKRVQPNQFVMHLRSFQGGFAHSNIEGITSPAYTILDFRLKNSHDPLFWREVLSSKEFIKRLETVTYGIRDGKSISFTDFSTLEFMFGSFSEQNKIGAFLKALDDTIALHQRKLENLYMVKKAYLQQLFPQADEKIPKLRFVNFNKDWEQRKLGKVVQINMGQSPKGETYTVNPSDYILVQGNADMKNGKVYPRLWTTQVTKTAEPGDIILSVRAPVGDVGKTDYNVVLGRGVAGIKGNEFIYQSLAQMKLNGFWTRYSTGSTFESINSNDLKEALVSFPSEQEQIKIGAFLKEFDEIILLHQQKMDTVTKLKKAYLQKIFI